MTRADHDGGCVAPGAASEGSGRESDAPGARVAAGEATRSLPEAYQEAVERFRRWRDAEPTASR